MSRKFIVLSALALGLMVPASAKTYTRDEAVKTAMENSADIKSAEEDLVKASSAVDGGYGAAYPQVDLSADIKWLLGRDDVTFGTPMADAAKDSTMGANKFDKERVAPALDGLSNAMKAQTYPWQSSVSLTVSQVLYAAGQIGTGINIAKGYKLLAETQLADKKSSVRYDVEKAFNNLLFMDSSITILEENIKLTEANVELAKQSVISGTGKELDQIRAELALEGLKSKYEKELAARDKTIREQEAMIRDLKAQKASVIRTLSSVLQKLSE